MSKKEIEVTGKGFKVSPNASEQAKKNTAKSGTTQNARIEAKLDLILEKLGITL